MNLLELRSFIRERLDDESTPHQWSDKFIDAAINRAEREAAERALLIYDNSKEIAVIQDQAEYSIPLTTIIIDRASINNNPLAKTTEIALDSYSQPELFRDFFTHSQFYGNTNWETLKNKPAFYVQDGYKIRLVGIPDADYTLKLDVYRRPENKLANDSDTPEIPEEYHEFLIHYVLYEAYSRRDEDLYDPNTAQLNMAEFSAIFGNKRSAKHMSMVKRHTANSRVYGRAFR